MPLLETTKATTTRAKPSDFGCFASIGGFARRFSHKNHHKMPIHAICGWFSSHKFSQKPPTADLASFFEHFPLFMVVFVSPTATKNHHEQSESACMMLDGGFYCRFSYKNHQAVCGLTAGSKIAVYAKMCPAAAKVALWGTRLRGRAGEVGWL